MSIVDAIKNILANCPYDFELATFDDIHIDITSDEQKDITSCAISKVATQVTKKYIDGSKITQFSYNMLLKAPYSQDTDRAKAIEELDSMENWITDYSMIGSFPKLDDSQNIESISSSNGTLYEISDDGDKAIYQLQIQLKIFRGVS